jgi:flagellar export protein FliJ
MKRFHFRLAKVQRVRRIEEDRAVAALAAANATVVTATRYRHHREEAYAAVPREPARVGVSGFLAARGLRDLAADAVQAAAAAEALAMEAAADRRHDWSVAAARVAVLDHLEDRRREEYALESLRAETVAVDDLVTARHGRDVR